MIYIKFHHIHNDESYSKVGETFVSNTYSFINNYFQFTNLFYIDLNDHYIDYYEPITKSELIDTFNFFEKINYCQKVVISLDSGYIVGMYSEFSRFKKCMKNLIIPNNELVNDWMNLKINDYFLNLISFYQEGCLLENIKTNAELMSYNGPEKSLIDYLVENDKYYLLDIYLLITQNELRITNFFDYFIFNDNLNKLIKLNALYPGYKISSLKYKSLTKLFEKDDILPLLCFITSSDMINYNVLVYLLIMSNKFILCEDYINEFKRDYNEIFEMVIIEIIFDIV